MSLPDLKLGKTLFATPGYDIASVIPNPAGDDVAGYAVDDHYYHSEWTDPAMHEVQAAMDKAVGNGRHAHILSWSADRTKLLVSVGSASQAGIIYYFDTGSGRMQRCPGRTRSCRAHPVAGPHHPLSRARRHHHRGGADPAPGADGQGAADHHIAAWRPLRPRR